MTIKCGSVDCKWNNDDSVCEYENTLFINDSYVHTMNNGFQHFHHCMGYEKSEKAERFESEFAEFLKGEISRRERGI